MFQGKTLSLYYLLSVRVARGFPTLLQYHKTKVWFFNKDGVTSFDLDMHWLSIPNPSTDRYWALVDSNQNVTMPATLLQDAGSPFFIIYASSPRSNRWNWVKYRYPATTYHFHTKPFSLKEIFMGVSAVIVLELGV
jgi:hypothetical protein